MTTAAADDHDESNRGSSFGPSIDETYLVERHGPSLAVVPEEAGPGSNIEAELYVERVGPPGARTIYYLHGGPGYNSYSFRELVGDDLTDYDVIYADQRGGGRSYGAASVSVTTLAEDVVAVLETLEVSRATLLAHGFGAAIAVRTAALKPVLIERVVLVNPWLSMPLLAQTLNDEARNLSSHTSRQRTVAEDEPPVAASDAVPTSDPQVLVDEAFASVNPKVLFDSMEFPSAAGRLHLEHVDAVALTGDLADEVPPGIWSVDELETLSQLEASGVSVVVVSGSHDLTSYPVQAEQALLRSATALFSLIDAGHYPWLDDPEAFTEVLVAALGGGPVQGLG